jgi:arginase family enzyme
MNFSDYLIPAAGNVCSQGYFGDMVVKYEGDPFFEIPASVKVAIIGIPEDRFTDGAGEIKSPGIVRKQLFNLSGISQEKVVDLGNLRTGKTLADTYFSLRDVLVELYQRNIAVLLIGGTMDLFYGNYLAMEGQKLNMTTISPQLRFPENHPLNTLILKPHPQPLSEGEGSDVASPLSFGEGLGVRLLHFCNIGYQSYYVQQQDLDYFSDRHFEAYRLGEVREENMRGCEPVIRDSDLLAVSMNAVKYSDAPAASVSSPNGFTGEEICQLAFYAGLSHRCRSLGIFDVVPQNDIQDITAKLAAQMAWYFIDGVTKRNPGSPENDNQNFKKFLIYFDQLHHHLCFYKNMQTERWWMEVPSLSGENNNLIISCTQDDYVKAAEQEIPDRWWKAYQRINF